MIDTLFLTQVRATHDDNIKDYIKWVIILLLEMDVPPERAPQLERARKYLQDYVKDAASVLRTQTMVRDSALLFPLPR